MIQNDFYQVLWNGNLMRYHKVGESGQSIYWTCKSMMDCSEFDEWKIKEVDFEEYHGVSDLSISYIQNRMENVFEPEERRKAEELSKKLWSEKMNPKGIYKVAKFFDNVKTSIVAEGLTKKAAYELADKMNKENKGVYTSYEAVSESNMLSGVNDFLEENGFKPVKPGNSIYEFKGLVISAGGRTLSDVKSEVISLLAQADMQERMEDMAKEEQEEKPKKEAKKKTRKKKEEKQEMAANPESETATNPKPEKPEEKQEAHAAEPEPETKPEPSAGTEAVEEASGEAGEKAEAEAGDGLPMESEDEDVFKENTESVDPVFVSKELQEVQTPIFRRITLDGNRYYFRVMEDGYVKIYASGTNLIKDGYADNKDALNEWKGLMKNLGQDPVKVAEYEADKGTIMHYFFGLYLMGRDIYLRRSFIVKTLKESNLKLGSGNMERFIGSVEDLDNMIDRIRRFAKFCTDYKVKPLLIEKILCLNEYEVASPIDLVCEMTTEEVVEGYFGEVYQRSSGGHKKGDPKLSKKKVEKKMYAIVDFKSGGIWPSYALQLEMYRRMVNRWYEGKIEISKIFNFSPKTESSKGYTLRDQTDSKEIRKADAVFEQGKINHQNKEKKYKMFVGKLNINNGYDEEKVCVTYDIAYELSKRFGNY